VLGLGLRVGLGLGLGLEFQSCLCFPMHVQLVEIERKITNKWRNTSVGV
jgi:hypothetical protein